jgi:hypothetical protein
MPPKRSYNVSDLRQSKRARSSRAARMSPEIPDSDTDRIRGDSYAVSCAL